MKTKLFVCILFFVNFMSYSQSPLSIGKDYWSGTAVYQDSNKIGLSEFKNLVKNNPEIVKKISSAQINRTIGNIITTPSAFVFGYTIGLSLNGKNSVLKPNWTVGGIGALGMVVGMIIQGKGNKQLKDAVDNYNISISKNSSSFDPEFSISSSEGGIGLVMRF